MWVLWEGGRWFGLLIKKNVVKNCCLSFFGGFLSSVGVVGGGEVVY